MLRTGPGWLQRPDRGAAGNVQHLAHPQRRQSLPEGRRHPEGVVPGNPSGPQMSPLQGPLHHLQRQLGLRPAALPLLRNPRRLTPVLVRGPAFRQIKPLVHQGPSQRTDAGQEHSGLAAGHLAQSPAVLTGHSHGLPALLREVAAVQHPHRIRMSKPGSQVLLKASYDCVVIPGGFSEKPLHHPG